jgi:TPR repeat protein
MIDDVINRLANQRLVLIHGSSGCGKSSLVHAGVLPRLARQYQRYGASWLSCAMRPAGGPLWNLAREFARLEGCADNFELVNDLVRLCNRRNATISAVAATLSGVENKKICLLIDQFEELFRFEKETSREEAELFVSLLTQEATLEQERLNIEGPEIHIVITMRSEFLGDCARFDGLSEAINRTQYLVPPMGRDDLVRAIRRPASLYGGEVSTDLSDRLIDEARGRDDELPLIQHGLMLIWNDAAKRTELSKNIIMDCRLLDEAGGLAELLSGHADKVMTAVATNPERQYIVEQLFRALTDINAEGRAIRRPQPFGDLVSVTEGSVQDVRAVVDAFRRDGVSFLTPYEPEQVENQAIVDISHEALIRCWRSISDPQYGWLKKEFDDGLIWRSLLVEAKEFETNPKHILSKATTLERRNWVKKKTKGWSERFGGNWELVERLISASKSASDWETRKQNIYVAILFGLLIGACSVAKYAWDAKNEALAAEKEAVTAKNEATQVNKTYQIALNELVNIAYPKRAEQNLKKDNSQLMTIYKSGAESGNDRSMYVFGVLCLEDATIPNNKEVGLYWIKKAIDKGNIDAMVKLAQIYQEGQIVTKDANEALQLMRKAAERQDPEATNGLAMLLLSLPPVESKTRLEAIELLRKASPWSAAAKNNLAHVLETSPGSTNEDESRLFQLYREAADAGDVTANYNLGIAFLRGRGVSLDAVQAAKFLRIAADAGSADAAAQLGEMYRQGLGVPPSDTEALKLYRKAEKVNNPIALNRIGEMYFAGRVVSESYSDALKYYRLAESFGNADAARNLGEMYKEGYGVTKDMKEAARLYHEAANNGSIRALVDLGILYRDGTGETKNYAEAAKLFQRAAADANNADAQYLLGLMYEKGQGVTRSFTEALNLYNKARDSGHAEAMYRLGLMYRRGNGVEKNETMARHYLQLAQAAIELGLPTKGSGTTRQQTISAKKCQLIVGGHDYLGGKPCKLLFTPGVGLSFSGVEGEEGKYLARVIFPSPGKARGYWNGPSADDKATFGLGDMTGNGACWVNSTAKICALK